MTAVGVWQVFPGPDEVALEAARRILEAAAEAVIRRGRFSVVLAGGRTPEVAYRLLSRVDADWADWQFYFGDERCLPADHPERNSRMAQRAWFDALSLDPAQIHPIPAELGAEAAVEAYSIVVEAALPFDMVLLGMGEDGHTASLFPGHVHPADQWVHAVHNAPKPPSDRVSLSLKALSQSHRTLVLVTGASKAEAVAAWRAGVALPVAGVRALDSLEILLDEAAAPSLK